VKGRITGRGNEGEGWEGRLGEEKGKGKIMTPLIILSVAYAIG